MHSRPIKDQSRAGSGSGGPATAAVDADTAMASELSMLLRVTQLMEDCGWRVSSTAGGPTP